MWQCDNCGYSDEDVAAFEEDTEEGLEDTVRYCPECGSDEIFQVDEDEEDEDFDDEDEEEEDEDDDEDDDEDGEDEDWDSNGSGKDDGDDHW